MFKINKKIKRNGGFTYVELIVVLSIFAIMSSVVIFNYGSYQTNVDIKVMANNIALKIVQAQKDATSGKWNPNELDNNWKPSYGIYFPVSGTPAANYFLYFADLDSSSTIDNQNPSCFGECLANVSITKGIYIKQVKWFSAGVGTINNSGFDLTFTRPGSNATFYFNSIADTLPNDAYVQIMIASPESSVPACIQIYSSGRIQIGQCQ